MKHYHKNPRQISEKQFKQLQGWLEEYGDLSGIVHNIRTDEIIGGNQRAEAMHLIGNGAKPVIEHRYKKPTKQGTVAEGYYEYKGERFKYRQVKWSDKKSEGANVIANKAGGTWDGDVFLNSWEASDLMGWGFEQKELESFGFEFEDEGSDAEPQIHPDRFEEIAKKWKTKPGQLWKADKHYLYCGDSLSDKSIEIVLQGQEPALIEADPPYGVNIVAANVSVGGGESSKGMIPFGGVKHRRLRGSVGASKPFGSKAVRGTDGAAHVVEAGKYPVIIGDENTETAKEAVALYLERFDGAYHVWWGANYYAESVKPSPCWLVWNKETTGNFADCELAWTNAEMSAKLFTHRWNGMLRDSERERRWHPTQKPAALAEWSFGLFTDEGDVILDPFGGAGWTLLAAQNSNRKACVIEKSHEYLAVQLERLTLAFPGIEIKRLK